MGGRSRKETGLTDRWAWIAELSDQRLNNYGYMSARSIDRNPTISKEALNFELGKYFERKFGYKPEWAR